MPMTRIAILDLLNAVKDEGSCPVCYSCFLKKFLTRTGRSFIDSKPKDQRTEGFSFPFVSQKLQGRSVDNFSW